MSPFARTTHRKSFGNLGLSRSKNRDSDDDEGNDSEVSALTVVPESRYVQKSKAGPKRRADGGRLPPLVSLSTASLAIKDIKPSTQHRIAAYCTCGSYNMRKLRMAVLKYKMRVGTNTGFVFGQCQTVQNVILINVCVPNTPTKGYALVFSFGCVVMWGLSESEDKELLSMFSKFEVEPVRSIDMDEFEYVLGEKTSTKDGEIVIETGDGMYLAMVVASHAFAQSVKVASFEDRVEQTIQTVEPLAKELQQKGRLKSLSTHNVDQRIGTLFLLRTQVNFADIADAPAFLWDLEDLENAHSELVKYLSIPKRISSLNDRMDTLGYLYDILREESNTRHAVQLEWIVIILIAIEVVLSVLPYTFGGETHH
jgi:uncharacterized Rmd1/YagE family protein